MGIKARAFAIGLVVLLVAMSAGVWTLGGLGRGGSAGAAGLGLICNAHGALKPGGCACEAGFAGTSCQYSSRVTCSGNGVAEASGGCTCEAGFAGASCQYSSSVTCSGHGVAEASGACACEVAWAGPSCTTPACGLYGKPGPDGTCVCDLGFVTPPTEPTAQCLAYVPELACSSHGQLVQWPSGAKCVCNGGFAGATCQFSDAATCDGHGVAQASGACTCQGGWAGANCAVAASKACNSAGAYDPQQMLCHCNQGFAGNTCQYSDLGTCDGHGVAQRSGACVCSAGWAGSSCQAR